MKTSYAITLLRQCRENQISLLEKHESKVHVIPEGFNNSLFWNAAHSLVSQQLLVYKLSNLDPRVDASVIDAFRKGSKGSSDNQIPLSELIQLMRDSVDWLEEDLQKGIFKAYNTYPTSFGTELHSADEAIDFNNLHEGLHFGYMMAMVKSL